MKEFVFDPESFVFEFDDEAAANFGIVVDLDDEEEPFNKFLDALIEYVEHLGGRCGGSLKLAPYENFVKDEDTPEEGDDE